MEIRICDTPLRLSHAVLLVGYCRLLADFLLRRRTPIAPEYDAFTHYNKINAYRSGFAAEYVDSATLRSSSLTAHILHTLEALTSCAERQGSGRAAGDRAPCPPGHQRFGAYPSDVAQRPAAGSGDQAPVRRAVATGKLSFSYRFHTLKPLFIMCSFATIVSTDIHRIEDTMYNFSRYQAKELALAYERQKHDLSPQEFLQQLKSSERSFEHLLKHGSEMPRDLLVKASERPVAGHFSSTPPVASLTGPRIPGRSSPLLAQPRFVPTAKT